MEQHVRYDARASTRSADVRTGLRPEAGDRIVPLAGVRVRSRIVRQSEVFDALEAYQAATPIQVAATDRNFHIFLGPWSRQSACDRAKDFLGKAGLSFESVPAVAGKDVVAKIGNNIVIESWDQAKFSAALKETGYPPKADLTADNIYYYGLWYPIIVALMTFVIGLFFVKETRLTKIHTEH